MIAFVAQNSENFLSPIDFQPIWAPKHTLRTPKIIEKHTIVVKMQGFRVFSTGSLPKASWDSFFVPLAPLLDAPRASWRRLGHSWAAFWALLARSGTLLDVLWASLGPSWLALTRRGLRKFVDRSSEDRFRTILPRFFTDFWTPSCENVPRACENRARTGPQRRSSNVRF